MSAAIQTQELVAALQLATSNKDGIKFLTALAEALPRSPQLVSLDLIEALYEFTTRRSYHPARARGAKALAAALSLAAPSDSRTFTSGILATEVAIRATAADRSADLLRRKAFACVLAISERDPKPLANEALITSLIGFAVAFDTQRRFVYRVLDSVVAARPQIAAAMLVERDAQLGRRASNNYAIYDRLTEIARGKPAEKKQHLPVLSNLTAELTRLTAT